MTTVRLAHRTVNGTVRTMLVEHHVLKDGSREWWQPIALSTIFDEAELRAYVAEIDKAMAQPILEIDGMEYA